MSRNEEILNEIYYKPTNLWVGRGAINKLVKASGIGRSVVKKWLLKQDIYQVHMPIPSYIPHVHYTITKPYASV